MFAKNLKLDDDYTLETSADTRRGLLQLAMYAMHVGSGSTLLCKTIKVATVKLYVRAAATFLSLFGEHSRDYRKDYVTDAHLSPTLTSVFDELQRWEKVANRREPYTLEMLDDLKNTATLVQNPDSLLAAAADWFQCGLHAGLRLTEWAQEAGCADLQKYKKDFHNDARAFLLGDIRFEDDARTRFTAQQVLAKDADTSIVKCWVKFRTQKNGQNGEEKLFTRNDKGHCFVGAMLRILRRFVRIRGFYDEKTPLALYKNEGDSEGRFITASDIETIMRHNAANVYKLDPVRDKKALQLWSSHSLRVGACVLLHASGCTESTIQWLLRWRSNAFMAYLRNVAILCNNQNAAFDKAAAMPQFM